MAALALAPWEPFALLPRASLVPMLVATADRHVLSLETYSTWCRKRGQNVVTLRLALRSESAHSQLFDPLQVCPPQTPAATQDAARVDGGALRLDGRHFKCMCCGMYCIWLGQLMYRRMVAPRACAKGSLGPSVS